MRERVKYLIDLSTAAEPESDVLNKIVIEDECVTHNRARVRYLCIAPGTKILLDERYLIQTDQVWSLYKLVERMWTDDIWSFEEISYVFATTFSDRLIYEKVERN